MVSGGLQNLAFYEICWVATAEIVVNITSHAATTNAIIEVINHSDIHKFLAYLRHFAGVENFRVDPRMKYGINMGNSST